MRKFSILLLLILISITSFGQSKFYKSYDIVSDSVFNEYKEFFMYFESGIVSKKDGRSIIPKSYQNIALENEYLICKKIDTVDNIATYDIYNWSKKAIIPFKLNITSFKDFPLQIFHPDYNEDITFRYCIDSTFYSVMTPKGTGLYFLDLFNYSYAHHEVFDATQDFVAHLGSNKIKVFALKNGELIAKQHIDNKGCFAAYPFSGKKSIYFNMDFHLGYDEDALFYVDGMHYPPQNDSETGEVYYSAIEKPVMNLSDNFYGLSGIEVINDSLIYLQGFFIDQEYPIYDEEGFELFDDFGDIIYAHDPGEFTSGMYNLKKQEWVVERNKSFILKTYLGFLEETATYSEEEKGHIFSYSFKNNDGSYTFEDINIEALMALEDANQYIVPTYKIDSITPFMHVSKLWTDGESRFCEKNANSFYYLLPNHREYEAYNLPSINEVSVKYAIETEAIQFYTDDTLVSFPLSGDVLLFELSEMSDGYFDKLYLQTNNQLFDISDFSFTQIKTLELQHLDSLLKKYHNVIMQSDGDSVLTFRNSYSDEIYDEYGVELFTNVKGYSGVYNYQTKNWLADPIYRTVLQLEDGYLLWFPKEIKVEYQDDWGQQDIITTVAEEYFTIIDAEGKEIETAKKLMDLSITYLSKIDTKELVSLQLNDFEKMQIQYGLVSYIVDEDLGGDGVFYGKSKDNKWGLYQTYYRGEIIPAKYDSIARLGWNSPFTIVWNNAKAGIYKDVFGEPSESIPCKYEDAKIDYYEGRYYLSVQKDGKWGYVDWYNGNELTKFIYDSIQELPWPGDYPSQYYD